MASMRCLSALIVASFSFFSLRFFFRPPPVSSFSYGTLKLSRNLRLCRGFSLKKMRKSKSGFTHFAIR